MKTIIIDGIEYNLTPKMLFKKGDFVVIQETTYQITKVENLNVTLSLNGRECIFDIDVLKNAHLWTIQDAKEGDVLAYVTDEEDLWIMIYRSLYEPYEGLVHYHALLINDKFSDKGTCCICIDNLKPATKEQRDTLIKAMSDAGYTFDFEKKELKKIAQNPALSEEDENAINLILSICNDFKNSFSGHVSAAVEDDIKKIDKWLKSLKERYTWKPTEEQMDALDYYANSLCTYCDRQDDLRSLLNVLKKL